MLNKHRVKVLAILFASVSGAPLSSRAGDPAPLTPKGYRVSQDVYVPRHFIIRACTSRLKTQLPPLVFQEVIFLYLLSTADRTQERVWGMECIFRLTGNQEEQSTVIDLARVDSPRAPELRRYLKNRGIELR